MCSLKKFLTYSYLFAGIGQYKQTIPEEQKESFLCWIQGNGSAFCDSGRDASEEEIKNIRKTLFDSIAEKIKPALNGRPFSIAGFSDEFGKKAVENREPFYTR